MKLGERKDLAGMSESQLQANMKDLDEQLKSIEDYRNEYFQLKKDIEDTEASHVILTGIRRNLMISVIKYYFTHTMFYDGASLHPEFKEVLNEVDYLINNNLPVRREVSMVSPSFYTKSHRECLSTRSNSWPR